LCWEFWKEETTRDVHKKGAGRKNQPARQAKATSSEGLPSKIKDKGNIKVRLIPDLIRVKV
jgi:hypothetical protein